MNLLGPLRPLIKRRLLPYYSDLKITESFPAFTPNCGGSREDRAAMIVACGNRIFSALDNLLNNVGKKKPSVITSDEFCRPALDGEFATALAELFTRHGSDKATVHDYHKVYGRILARRHEPLCLLEFGLGTGDQSIPNNMGVNACPGASLRAFRDFLPRGEIYGADIDTKILFAEDRIKTFQADQLDYASLVRLGAAIGRKFDLIIDDGLHSPLSNLNVLSFALSQVKPGGAIVIEDIAESNLPIWNVVARLLPGACEVYIINCLKGYLFVVLNAPACPVPG